MRQRHLHATEKVQRTVNAECLEGNLSLHLEKTQQREQKKGNETTYLCVLLVLKLKPQQIQFVHFWYEKRVTAVVEDAAVERLRAEQNPLFLQPHSARYGFVVKQTFGDDLLFKVTLI